MDVDRVKGTWGPKEDESLIMLVQRHGARNWTELSESVPGRSGKSCRLRWFNHLCPGVERQGFTAEEDEVIVQAHAKYGNKWARISRVLNGRTDNSIKNRWNSTLKRKFCSIKRKIDFPSRESTISVLSSSKSSDSIPSPDDQPSTRLTLSLPGTEISPPRRQQSISSPPATAEEILKSAVFSGLDFSSLVQLMIREEVRNYMRNIGNGKEGFSEELEDRN